MDKVIGFTWEEIRFIKAELLEHGIDEMWVNQLDDHEEALLNGIEEKLTS